MNAYIPAFTKSVYLYCGSPLAPSSVTGVYIKTKLESMSSTVNKYSSSSAPAITTGLPFHFFLNQLKKVNRQVTLCYFHAGHIYRSQCINIYVLVSTNNHIFTQFILTITKIYINHLRMFPECVHTNKQHIRYKAHLATHFPGVPPHHATTAWPFITLPSTSSP